MKPGIFETLSAPSKSIQLADTGSSLISGTDVTVKLPGLPIKYLYHGWQSWSLTAWVDLNRPLKIMRPGIMNPGQTDPEFLHDLRPNGSWYGAVELEDGKIAFLGALGLDAHVALEGGKLKGRYAGGNGDWLACLGDESDIFNEYATRLKERFGSGRSSHPMRVWCSWYSLYTEIDQERLLKVLSDLDGLPGVDGKDKLFDIFQIDDGWQQDIGDWEPNAKFLGGMDGMAARIKDRGRVAGLWLAPLVVSPSSNLFRRHQEWLLRDQHGKLVSAGFNWGRRVFALDTTHPDVQAWLANLMQKVRRWGYDYIKLDFLYGGALPGRRHVDKTREAAYREGLQVIRKALGEAYFLACGAPLIPSIGLCDGMRVGPDVASQWDDPFYRDILRNFAAPGAVNALRTSLNRLWMQPLFQTDPDVVYFGQKHNFLTEEQRAILQNLAQVSGFIATSDIPNWLTDAEKHNMVKFIKSSSRVEKLGKYRYRIDGKEVDFSSFIEMPPLPGALSDIIGSYLDLAANVRFPVKIVDMVSRGSLKKYLKNNPV